MVYSYGKGKVLKLFYPFMPKEFAIREYNNTVVVQKHFKNSVKAYKLIEKDGRNGIVYERVNGKDLLSVMISTGAKSKKAITMFTKCHVAIGQVEITSKEDRNKMDQIKDYLTWNIKKAELLSKEERRRIISYLDQLPDENRVCHLDYHPGNVVVRDGKPVVIDWMNACIGSREADVARTLIMMRYSRVPEKPWLVQNILSLATKYIYKSYLRQYCNLTRCSREQIADWMLPIAAARLAEGVSQKEKERLLRMVKKKLGRK